MKCFLCFEVILSLVLFFPGLAVGQGSREDYARASSLAERTENKVYRSRVQPTWLPGGDQFWYRVETGPGQHEFIWVDAAAGVRRPAFDHGQLAASLSKVVTNGITAERLPIQNLEFRPNESGLRFNAGGKGWQFGLRDFQLSEVIREGGTLPSKRRSDSPKASRRTGAETEIVFINRSKIDADLFWLDSEGARRGYGRVRVGQERLQHTFEGHVWLATDPQGGILDIFEAGRESGRAVITGVQDAATEPAQNVPVEKETPGRSPDGVWIAEIVDHNLLLRPTGSGDSIRLTHDGTLEDPYVAPAFWAPDSKHVVVLKRREAQEHKIHMVESSPAGQLQPKWVTQDYLKPGDRIAHPRPRLFDVATKKSIALDESLYENPWDLSELHWQPDSRAFSFVYNQRGHQVLRLVSIDAATGGARSLIEEVRPESFVDYAHKFHLTRLDATSEAIWMSERSGWNHLWLVDATAAKMKNPITQGEWVVRQVETVDQAKRQIWFQAGGIRPEEDPYQLHLCRVNFDGTGLVVLTEGDGSHTVEFSPDRRWFVDTWSRPDQPPVIELRNALDGARVCVLERADWSSLLAAGWTAPERFKSVARDGKTPIYGILIKPSNFDPAKKYPVVEEVYAGPQGAYVPKQFGRLVRQHALAELGFVVVQVDGMGTSYRSKAFHDVCARNLADAGFADRIAWIRSAASTRPWMDLGRVGIYGGSAGGQNAMRALLDHSDFYRVAVADCGCHDNRMDKIWWNELWLGWPVGEAYVRSSNVEDAAKLKGRLMLVVGELDSNVDPASTYQVVNALQKADKDYELVLVTGANHGAAETPYGTRRRMDFLVRHLHGREPRWTVE